MWDVAGARLRRRVLGLQLRVWGIAGVVGLVGLAIVPVVWAIVSGRDVVAIVGDVLTFITLVAAVVALRYAAQSAQAALDTVEPMKEMAANLTTTAATLRDMAANLTATAETMKANLELAERGRQEDRLIHRLAQQQRVYEAAWAIRRMVESRVASHIEVRDGEATVRAALASLPPDELPASHRLADAPLGEGLVPMGGVVDSAIGEVEEALRETLESLERLLARS